LTRGSPGPGLFGLALGADGAWRFASNVELVAGIGIEDVFLTTHLKIRGVPSTSLAPWSAIGETGLRFDF
jgi:hypothetical protein